MTATRALHARSLSDPEGFWAEQARRIDWETSFDTVLDDSRPPFTRWFVGGRTNLCHNAVDRHLAERADQAALIYVSTETGQHRTYSYAELHDEVNRMAAILQQMGVVKGDRVLIYMPMIPEAAFAMLACARIGAIHSVVFGGFASVSLAARIDDARPRVIVSADAGSRAGKVVPYKPLLDEAVNLAAHKPERVLLVDRQLCPMTLMPGRDEDYGAWRERVGAARVPCVWLESSEPSYVLYTSGTTGKPKGVQRDTGGYAVALAASMDYIFCGKAGDTMFSSSDIGWVVGHSYIVYGPLLVGMATVMYEGTPIRPDGGILWQLVEQYHVNIMFSAPTAIRVLKKQDPAWLTRYDLKIVDEATGAECPPGQKGLVAIDGPLPPGCMTTVWGDDERFVKTYWSGVPGRRCYSTFDWGVQDEDGYIFILGRTDDVINVAGHRLGTREIEESISSHPAVAEVAVVGVHDALKGQVAMAFVIVRDAGRTATQADRLALEGDVMKTVDQQLGAVARPARVFFVNVLPKTRSGKLLRRAMQAVAEGRDPGDLTTIEDPTALAQLQAAMQG